MERVLHACWLLDAWSPKRDQYLKAWQKRGWPIVLWHGGQLSSPPVEGVELRLASELFVAPSVARCVDYEASFKNHASCADLFRYAVLHAEGGAYVDLDVRPLAGVTPALFDVHTQHPVFCREWRGPLVGWSLEIRFILTPRVFDPLIKALLDTAVLNTRRFMDSGGYLKHGICDDKGAGICKRTGPDMAATVVKQQLGSLKKTIFPFINQSTEVNCQEHFTMKYPQMKALIEERKQTGEP